MKLLDLPRGWSKSFKLLWSSKQLRSLIISNGIQSLNWCGQLTDAITFILLKTKKIEYFCSCWVMTWSKCICNIRLPVWLLKFDCQELRQDFVDMCQILQHLAYQLSTFASCMLDCSKCLFCLGLSVNQCICTEPLVCAFQG